VNAGGVEPDSHLKSVSNLGEFARMDFVDRVAEALAQDDVTVTNQRRA
jgi:hypothetical protein